MSAETQPLATAANQKNAPQYYNPASDAYEHLNGSRGASFVHVLAYDPVSDTNLEVTQSARGLDAIPLTAQRAFITVEGGALRYRVTAQAPTNVVGHKLLDGDICVLDSRQQILDFRAIALTGVPAALQITYFGGA